MMTTPFQLEWEDDHFEVEGKPFIPVIYDALNGEQIPEGYNACSLLLDARLQSKLQWEEQLNWAEQLVDSGYQLFWQLDFGICRDLCQPLSDEMQFRSFGIAVDHFVHSVWTRFQAQSLGVSLYRGSLDFSRHFPWTDEQRQGFQDFLKEKGKKESSLDHFLKQPEGKYEVQLFCRDVVVEYLELLSTRLPPSLLAFALVESYGVSIGPVEAELLSREAFQHIHPIVRGQTQAHRAMRWEGNNYTSGFIGRWKAQKVETTTSQVGVLLPARERSSWDLVQKLGEVVNVLDKERTVYRYIPESLLTMDWEGLESVIYVSEGVSPAGFRQLQGFVAAGGRPVAYGEPLGLDGEELWLIEELI